MKRLIFALAILLACASPGFPQNAKPSTVVASCGSLSLSPGQPAGQYVDTTGVICTGAAVGGASIDKIDGTAVLQQLPGAMPVTLNDGTGRVIDLTVPSLVTAAAATTGGGTLQAAATGTGNGNALQILGYGSASFDVNCSGCSGTSFGFWFSQDNSQYYNIPVARYNGGYDLSSSLAGHSVWTAPVGNWAYVQARITAYSAGTVTITALTSPIANSQNPADASCDNSVTYDTNTSGNTQLVAISSTNNIAVCGFQALASGTVSLQFVAGTGTACASTAAASPSVNPGASLAANMALTPAYQFTTQTGLQSFWPARGFLFRTGPGNELCLKTNGSVSAQVEVWYRYLP